jgi:hypothetical protein
VAIARQELPLAKNTPPSTERLQTPTQHPSDEPQQVSKLGREAIKPSKSKSKEAASSSLSKEKKKKKKGKTDELSSLFGSLA